MFSWDQPFQLQSILFNLVVENLLHTCDANASKKCMRYSHHNAKASNLAPRVHVPLHMPTGNDACALHLIKLRLLTFAMFTMWNKIQALGNEKENFPFSYACICIFDVHTYHRLHLHLRRTWKPGWSEVSDILFPTFFQLKQLINVWMTVFYWGWPQGGCHITVAGVISSEILGTCKRCGAN